MIWAEMDYDSRLAAVAKLAREGNMLSDIATILSTNTDNVRAIAREFSIVIPTHRIGYAVPPADDPGIGGGGFSAARMASWRRATDGARDTLALHRNVAVSFP